MPAETRNLRLVPSEGREPLSRGAEAASLPAGEETRFEALARQYARLVTFAVNRVSRGRLGGAAEDVEQSVLIALWKRTESEQPIEHPSSYIYKAAVRETVRAVRRAAERPTTPIDLHANQLTSGEQPSDSLRGREIRERIEGALASMQPERALAARLHLQGLSVNEIMTLREWPYQKARNLIARGIADLRDRLKEGA